jgi:hypothetical protein
MNIHAYTPVVNYLMSAYALFRCPSLRSNLCVFICKSRNYTHSFPWVGRAPLVRKAHFGLLNLDSWWILNGTRVNGFGETTIPIPFYQYIFRIEYRSITRHEGMESIIITFLSKEGMKMKHIITCVDGRWSTCGGLAKVDGGGWKLLHLPSRHAWDCSTQVH